MKTLARYYMIMLCACGLAICEESSPRGSNSKNSAAEIESLRKQGKYQELLEVAERGRSVDAPIKAILALKGCDSQTNAALIKLLEKMSSDPMLIFNLESISTSVKTKNALLETISSNLNIPRPEAKEPPIQTRSKKIHLPLTSSSEDTKRFIETARERLAAMQEK